MSCSGTDIGSLENLTLVSGSDESSSDPSIASRASPQAFKDDPLMENEVVPSTEQSTLDRIPTFCFNNRQRHSTTVGPLTALYDYMVIFHLVGIEKSIVYC
jgi:hypothetical protein